ncbi:MAG: site-specific DNA-methyltransferase [Oxalobacteraceae bacterium]|nr:MAG: site-specific DNA-methyltransferase [Oxalobacteraceae bacterium]
MDEFISFPERGTLNIEIGDCVEVMKRLKAEGVRFDAIVSDPPYGILLHGRENWDNGELVFNKEFWTLCMDVLKPGGFLLAFAAGRKYHRVACAIEDAGMTLYPPLQWQFGGGLPKPANLSELFDRDNVKDRKVLGTKTGSGFTSANEKHGAQARNTKEFVVKERGVSEEAKKWDGFYYGMNTLKPAQEPIVLAQRPIEEKRMIDSVRLHGVGALNIGEIKRRTGGWPSTVFEFPKASVKDHKSNHPSVKNLDLMEALVALACPPGGHVLDPFAGTGSTGAAAIRAGFDATVIEMNPEMEATIRDRVNHRR